MIKLLYIKNLNLPTELQEIIYINYKYSMLETKYKRNYNIVLDNLKHYIFLNNKLNKKEHKQYTILDTIKYFIKEMRIKKIWKNRYFCQ